MKNGTEHCTEEEKKQIWCRLKKKLKWVIFHCINLHKHRCAAAPAARFTAAQNHLFTVKFLCAQKRTKYTNSVCIQFNLPKINGNEILDTSANTLSNRNGVIYKFHIQGKIVPLKTRLIFILNLFFLALKFCAVKSDLISIRRIAFNSNQRTCNNLQCVSIHFQNDTVVMLDKI